MSIVFIIMMVIGVLVAGASFLIPEEESKTTPLSFSKTESGFAKTESVNEPVAFSSNDAINAAKNKAKEKIEGGYKFDLHLNEGADTSDRTVEELERDLLGDLGLEEVPSEAELAKATSNAGNNSNAKNGAKGNSGKNNSKNRSGKKNGSPVNDRYDDLLYEPLDNTTQNAAAANKPAANNNNNNNKSNSSKGGKKGKKK